MLSLGQATCDVCAGVSLCLESVSYERGGGSRNAGVSGVHTASWGQVLQISKVRIAIPVGRTTSVAFAGIQHARRSAATPLAPLATPATPRSTRGHTPFGFALRSAVHHSWLPGLNCHITQPAREGRSGRGTVRFGSSDLLTRRSRTTAPTRSRHQPERSPTPSTRAACDARLQSSQWLPPRPSAATERGGASPARCARCARPAPETLGASEAWRVAPARS